MTSYPDQKIDFIDLKAQQKKIRPSLDRRIAKVLDNGKYILGPEVTELEELLARYVGKKHCVSCGNGTDALLMALMAYDARPGDAIFTSPFTFIATAEVIALTGATPVFVEIDERTYNIDPASLATAIESLGRTKPGLKARGIGVLITDHNVHETLAITDRSYLIYTGRLLKEGSAEFLASDETARRIYLGESFRLDR